MVEVVVDISGIYGHRDQVTVTHFCHSHGIA